MTIAQKEIAQFGKMIEDAGYIWWNGLADVTPENESAVQQAFAAMIIKNDKDRQVQEYAFQQMPGLRKLANQ